MTPDRQTPDRQTPDRQTKGERTRARLVTVAAQVFAEQGYAATTYEQLVQAAGLSRGAFYFHFPSKEHLAVEVLRATKQRWLDEVGRRVAGAPDAAAALRGVGAALVALHDSDPAGSVASALAAQAPQGSAVREAAAEVTGTWIGMIADLVRQGQADGSVRADLDAGQVAVLLFAAVDGLRDLGDLLDEPDRRRSAFTARVQLLTEVLDGGLLRVDPSSDPHVA